MKRTWIYSGAITNVAVILVQCAFIHSVQSLQSVQDFFELSLQNASVSSTTPETWIDADIITVPDDQTYYTGEGMYQVNKTKVRALVRNKKSTLHIYTPVLDHNSTNTSGEGSWPGIVFGHGLCGRVKYYSNLLKAFSSWGYVVVATDEMSDCEEDPVGNYLAINTTKYRNELIRNLIYLSEMEDVNASQIAIVGHSMGGGGAITAAAKLSETDPDLVKAVVGIAPWNGVSPVPSTVVSDIDVPILLFCGAKDGLTPCSGPVNIRYGFEPFTIPLASLITRFYGSDGIDWSGGVLSIFENVSDSTPAILADVKYANHLNIADTDGKKTDKLQENSSRSGLHFNEVKVPSGHIIPTAEYTVAFLDWALKGNRRAFDMLWGDGILSDNRFKQPILRAATDS